ncbi:MAG: alkaline phosphatase family protein [Solirubrobacteraceae bacterium]
MLTRRDFLKTGAGAVALSALGPAELVQRALATAPAGVGSLSDIEHVVFFIQENRSFDHYFGTFHGVTGFGDPGALPGVFSQPGYPVPGFNGHLNPFHLDSYNSGECTNDITHNWGPQQRSFNGGTMDGWVREHVKANGPVDGALTMGYYERRDLEFYYALADAFTICDHYHCSVLGPTDPNRLYTFAASLDPDGKHGGPILSTSISRLNRVGTLTYPTMPEQLSARGISWKVYGTPDATFGDNVLPYFKSFTQNPTLLANATTPTFPGSFEADVATGQLPQVSWVLAPLVASEHPPAPPELGELSTSALLSSLMGNPALWSKTAVFMTYDENGGFFDHVPPPVAPAGTPGEYLSVSPLPADAEGIAGPIGLGFRVPMLLVSPFARGGFVCSDTFDHTSLLRFLETRFGTEVPNLTSWRRAATGDLTSAFNFALPDASVPSLPQPSAADSRVLSSSCVANAAGLVIENVPTGLSGLPLNPTTPYPVPANGPLPVQEPGAARRPSGPLAGSGGSGSSGGGSGSGVPAESLAAGTAELRVSLHGVPRHCAHPRFHVRVKVQHSRRLKFVHARVNGRIAHSTQSDHFHFTVAEHHTHEGKNRVSVNAVDATGKRVVVVGHFRRC